MSEPALNNLVSLDPCILGPWQPWILVCLYSCTFEPLDPGKLRVSGSGCRECGDVGTNPKPCILGPLYPWTLASLDSCMCGLLYL